MASVANQGQPILSRAREGRCGTCQSEATEAETRVVAAFKFGHAPLNLWSSFQITRLRRTSEARASARNFVFDFGPAPANLRQVAGLAMYHVAYQPA